MTKERFFCALCATFVGSQKAHDTEQDRTERQATNKWHQGSAGFFFHISSSFVNPIFLLILLMTIACGKGAQLLLTLRIIQSVCVIFLPFIKSEPDLAILMITYHVIIPLCFGSAVCGVFVHYRASLNLKPLSSLEETRLR